MRGEVGKAMAMRHAAQISALKGEGGIPPSQLL